ncbi:hypothetical protein LTR62_001057 [Meristemomyces frigidus]|uniref:Uncharacterized protein n=1 Tax=Meristemomyces frigidus TaxID=1508187 RepID=A0AAN7YBX6_9PEZI|nr:hypothetical protein LTR62_001057 [Meristemomyces frigidus]
MSDPVAEPGAPTGAPKIPEANEKSVSAEVQKRVPNRLLRLAASPDSVLLRLNKILAQPGGLPAFLSTFNYTLYLLAYLETKVPASLKVRLYQLLNRTTSTPSLAPTTPGAPSPIMNLALMIGSARTTLRLFGLLPMYAGLRRLMQGPKPGQDQVLYMNSVVQLGMYMTFQFLENVALLTDNKILPASYTAKYTARSGGTTAKIYLWAYRAWFGGILCDFVRLGREAQLEASKRSSSGSEVSVKDNEKTDQEWWSQAVVPMAWTPMAAHCATEGGIPGFNVGIMGASGFMAGLGKVSDLWAKTAE